MGLESKHITFLSTLLLILQENQVKNGADRDLYEFLEKIKTIVEKIKNEIKKVEFQNFDKTFEAVYKLLILFLEMLNTNGEIFSEIINQLHYPVIKRKKFFILSRLKKLYFEVYDLMADSFEAIKDKFVYVLKGFDYQQLSLGDDFEKYTKNYLKFLFYFLVADLWINKEIKLSLKKRKLLYSELKRNAEIYFALLIVLGILKIDNATKNQLRRNIIITARVLALKFPQNTV